MVNPPPPLRFIVYDAMTKLFIGCGDDDDVLSTTQSNIKGRSNESVCSNHITAMTDK